MHNIDRVFEDSREELKRRIMRGDCMEYENISGETPLFKAGLEITNLLIKAGVNVNHKNRWGKTPLFEAGFMKSNLLISAGADVNIADDFGKTPLFSSGTRKSNLLIQSGAEINFQDNRGDTPLCFSDCEKTKLLIDSGANVNIINLRGESPLFYAFETFNLLIQAGANVNQRDKKNGKTALFYSNLNKTKFLVSHGANIDILDFKGKAIYDHNLSYEKYSFISKVRASNKIVRCAKMFISRRQVDRMRCLPENLFNSKFKNTRFNILGVSKKWQ